ncbi:MAG: T9SS type A sorting domain-containing protein [Bacteroidales bacterium]|nr:T9SS type A sorting domain-containing protein [Bacteroidales bacterium]
MRKTCFFFILLLLLAFSDLHAQEWHKIYFPDIPTTTSAVFESYDKGYVLGGSFQQGDYPGNGMIIKTDINGKMLWSKTVSSSADYTSVTDINPTNDHGLILTGITGEQLMWYNPFIMKLNACAEPEWCRIYKTPNENDEWGQSIWQIPGGYIALFLVYGEDPLNERIWLYRLDNEGGLIWKQVYAQSDTAIYDELGIMMNLTPDYHIIINGICYYPDPGIPWPQILRPFIIKTDSTGALEWELPWSVVHGENYSGESYNSITDNQGTIYSSARHIVHDPINQGDKPGMIKTDVNGNEKRYTDFFPDSKIGTTQTINWLADSTIVLGAFWTNQFGYDGNVGVIKCDRSGSIIKINPMFVSQHLFSDAVTTFDNKLLLVGGFWDGIWRSHAYKLNADLEYDTIYNQPFVYDSLCPHPIPSDTIPFNCVIVGLNDQKEDFGSIRMTVFPNPVSDMLNIKIPDQLKTTEKSNHFNITTFRSKWNNVTLEIYNLNGEQMLSLQVPYSEKEVGINVSQWKKGMYMIRLVYNNNTICTTKVIKNY